MDFTDLRTRRQLRLDLVAHVEDFAAMHPVPPGPELDYPIGEGIRIQFKTGADIGKYATEALDALFVKHKAPKWGKADKEAM